MAIALNGVKNSLTNNQIPTGYSRPAVTTFDDQESIAEYNLTVLKATVENSDPAVTMANILNDAVIGLTKQITDILDADYIATQTVTAWADFTHLSNNYTGISGEGDFLTDTANSYQCKVILYVKTA